MLTALLLLLATRPCPTIAPACSSHPEAKGCIAFADTQSPECGAEALQAGCDAGLGKVCSEAARRIAARLKSHDAAQLVGLYQRGCSAKDADACGKLGQMHEEGLGGLPRDAKKGIALTRQACDLGDPFYCTATGIDLARGKDVPRDEAGARTLLEKGCTGGVTLGCASLGKLLTESKVPADQKRGVEVADAACHAEKPDDAHASAMACDLLARWYAKGQFVARDIPRANALLERACTLGLSDDCFQLPASAP